MAETSTREASRDGGRVEIEPPRDGEGIQEYSRRVAGTRDVLLERRVLGAANPYKQGDEAVGVAAADERSRRRARVLLSRTRVRHLHETPIFEDAVQSVAWSVVDAAAYRLVADWTLHDLKTFLLDRSEDDIKAIAPGLSSDVIGSVVKLLSNDELIAIGAKVFHPLPGSKVGARGYLSARVQPNSPTDHPDDIVWQVFDGWSFAVGDLLLGTNPVDGSPESVAQVELALHDVIETFGLQDLLPHCVLSHIDVQAEVESRHPGRTGIWFQSLAGTESANRTFDVTVDKMMRHASTRTGRFGLYLETGQGADFTNGHGHGFDMVLHEARKYGFARALRRRIAEVQTAGDGPWLHVNDVAGFIGPEVFESREQLVRTCLEDVVMGKLHGLTIGLDVCSTLHMKVTPDDLDWCLDQIMPANPAYLMALPTKNDPMLSYLTTSFQDHVRIRERFGYRVDDRMWAFFQRLGVIDGDGRPTDRFGDPTWVFIQYRRAKGDERTDGELRREGARIVREVEARGVPLAIGHGEEIWRLKEGVERTLRVRYEDSRACLHAALTDAFIDRVECTVVLRTRSLDRDDYIEHPVTGEELDAESAAALESLRRTRGPAPPIVQIVVSDGLNAHALMDDGHALPYLAALRAELDRAGLEAATEVLVIHNGRVRAGYRCGETLFGDATDEARRAIVHVIGERPGSGHHNFSIYLAAAPAYVWRQRGAVDHDSARVISGVSDTALAPDEAARRSAARLMERLAARPA